MKGIALVCLVVLLASVLAETANAAPKVPKPPKAPKPPKQPKEVKCKHKKYTSCFNQTLYCPPACPTHCTADCDNCQSVCVAPVVYSPPPPISLPPPSPPAVSYPPPATDPFPPPSTPLPPYPPPQSSAAKKVRCKNRSYGACYYREHTCPAACAQTCEVDCVTCSPVCNCNKPGAVCQDPRFIGADGITFYFHGKKDQNFCLVADSNLHINAHFIGKRRPTMGRDFTWVQSLGILFDDHQIYIGALKTATWDDSMDRLSISFDGQPITLPPQSEGAIWQSPTNELTITRSKATNAVEIEVEGKFKIKAVVVPITEKESLIHNYGINEEDCFAHLDLSFKFYSLSGEVNGVLGQTYATNYLSQVKMGVANPILGGEKKFSTSSLFATDCAVASFVGKGSDNGIMEFADLNCATGGSGVVCRR